jgi:hypothetical protein
VIEAPRVVRWADWEGPAAGLEHCEVRPEADGLSVLAVVAGTLDGQRFGLSYELSIDRAWRVRRARLRAASGQSLALDAEGEGWRVDGSPAPQLAGCLDIDIRATPFTNTLPIRRAAPAVGQAVDIAVAFVAVPDLAVAAGRQRYTRLADRLFRFDGLEADFTADLPVDADGLVLDYPGLFRRLPS